MVLLWGGGIWNWFDPLTVIRRSDELAARGRDVRLVLPRDAPPEPGDRGDGDDRSGAASRRGARRSRDRTSFFNDGWVPYEERGATSLDADIGVSAHFDDVETRFAFRTRLLDCIWAGLPDRLRREVTTLGELSRERGGRAGRRRRRRRLGRRRSTDLLDDEQARLERPQGDGGLRRESFAWPRVAEPPGGNARPTRCRHVTSPLRPGSSRTRRACSACPHVARRHRGPAWCSSRHRTGRRHR